MISAAQSHPRVPAWITDALEISTNRGPNTEPVVEYDTEEAIIRATDHLRNHAPLAVEGDHGDATTNRVMARVKDYGVSPEMCLAIALEEWNPRCSPPWSPEALAYKIDSAWRSGKNPPGSAHSSVAFDVVPVDDEADILVNAGLATRDQPAKGAKFRLLMPGDIRVDSKSHYLVKGLIDMESVTVLYGNSNVGKSFLAMDLGAHIAAGRAWGGKAVKQGLVVHVAAEGGRSAKMRVLALKDRLDTIDIPFALLPSPVNMLRSETDLPELVSAIRRAEVDNGQPCVLVVIDTLSRVFAGGNENGSEDMGAFVLNVDRLRLTLGAAILIVHHKGKAEAAGARGHSLLRAAVDTEIEVALKEGGRRVASVTKQRDMAQGPPIAFCLVPVPVGVDGEGDQLTSCYVALEGDPAYAFESAQQPAAAESRARATEETTEALLTAIVQAMPADRCSLSSVVPAAAKVTGFKDRKTRQMIDEKVPLAPDFATATDQAGGVWRLRRVRAGDQKRAHVWLVREKIPMHGEGS